MARLTKEEKRVIAALKELGESALLGISIKSGLGAHTTRHTLGSLEKEGVVISWKDSDGKTTLYSLL